MNVLRTLGTLGAVVLVLAACDRDTRDMPRDFGPLTLGKDWRCPAIAGRYAYGGEPASWYLAGRFREYGDSTPIEFFTLDGTADTALHIGIGLLDGRVITKVLRKGTQYAGDYYCEDGWLRLQPGALSDRFDAEVASEGFFPRRRELLLATGRESALVARYDRTDYEELTVWCGDGCRGIPLPWTFETRSTWSRTEVWAEGAPRPSVVAAAREAERRRAEQERLKQDPVYQAEQALEQGPPVAGQADAKRRAIASLLPGMLVLAVAPRDSGWHISLEYEREDQILPYMDRLQQSGPVTAIQHDKLYRGRTPTGRLTTVVWVRFD